MASQVRRTSAVGAAQGVREAHERDLQQDKSAAITRASAAATARSHPNNTERGEGADHGTTPGGGPAHRVGQARPDLHRADPGQDDGAGGAAGCGGQPASRVVEGRADDPQGP